MKLTVWTYEGPPHVGAMRIATAMRDVHYVLHAPQGDTYADLLFTMIERRDKRPPVTYTTFKARDLGADTAELFQQSIRDACERFKPQALLVGASCTAELLQDDPEGLSGAIGLDIPVIPLELPSYQRKENWGASETFYQLVRALNPARHSDTGVDGNGNNQASAQHRPSCNILGPTALGYRHRDDVREISDLLRRLQIDVRIVAPLDATVAQLSQLHQADFNVVLYPEIAESAARWLERHHKQPFIATVPIGVGATRDFIKAVGAISGNQAVADAVLTDITSRLPWYSRSIDSNYLTGKRVFIFGDATHVIAAARIAREELAFEVAGIGTYSREFARPVRELAASMGLEALITDDYLDVEQTIVQLQPELILGTQMERHIAKRLRIPCAVISAPVHVQDYPARYSPQMGFEGANVIFDTWVHPLMMGLEEHLLTMFRDDFEFHDHAGPSHLGAPVAKAAGTDTDGIATGSEHDESCVTAAPESVQPGETTTPGWLPEAEQELKKIPFFVRGKARRNTERYAVENGIQLIALETLYDAKAHYSR